MSTPAVDERPAGAATSDAPVTTEQRDGGWAQALRSALGLWLLTRLAFVGFALGAMQASPEHSIVGKGAGWFPRLYYAWDSLNFYSIAAGGYDTSTDHPVGGPHNPAFFPGYPLLARLVAMPFDGAHPHGAALYWSLAIVSWAAAAVAAVLLWRLAAEHGGRRIGDRAVVLLLLGPYGVFLMASYSESLFLALAIGAWYLAGHRRWWAAGLLAAACGTVRVNALCLAAGLVVMFVLQRRSDHRPRRTDAIALVLPVAGTAVYFGWLRATTGSWRTYFNAEQYWHRSFTWPWDSLHRTIEFVGHPRGTRTSPILELVFAALALALLVALVVLRRWAEAVYVAASIASMVTSEYFLSLPRLCLVLFPAFVLLAEQSVRRRWVWPALLTASLTLLAVNSLTFVYHQWTQ